MEKIEENNMPFNYEFSESDIGLILMAISIQNCLEIVYGFNANASFARADEIDSNDIPSVEKFSGSYSLASKALWYAIGKLEEIVDEKDKYSDDTLNELKKMKIEAISARANEIIENDPEEAERYDKSFWLKISGLSIVIILFDMRK